MTSIDRACLRACSVVLAAALSSASIAFAADAPQKKEGQDTGSEHQLEGVTVRGKHDALSESDRKLKELQRSLPDLNSDAPKTESLGERTLDRARDYVAGHQDPNKLNDDSKTFLERMQNPLDRSRDDGVQPPLRRDIKDYADPLCQAGSCPP
jgi:hypothetical protein